MKLLKCTVFLVIPMIILTACGNISNEQLVNAEGFEKMETELKNKFGDNAYYTNLTIIYTKGIGNSMITTVTEDPESLTMEEWNLLQNTWGKKSEILLEVPEGTKAAEFMFQLDEKINLSKLGELVEKSIKQLTAEKNIENPTLSMAFIKFPKNGDVSKTEYVVSLEPEHGGTSFSFSYTLDGTFINMDY